MVVQPLRMLAEVLAFDSVSIYDAYPHTVDTVVMYRFKHSVPEVLFFSLLLPVPWFPN